MCLFLQHLSRGSANVPVLRAEVTQAWEATTTVVAARVVAVLGAEASALEAAVAWDSTAVRVKDVEDRAPLAEREARERVSRVEAENATMLASARKDVESLVRKIALLKGELVELRQAREVAEENSHDLSYAVADAERQWEVSKREHQEHFVVLTLQ
jgi:hypothetical protein